jgi:hypothetical protein
MNRKQSVSLVSVSALAAGMAQGAVTYSGLINTTLPKGSGATIQFDLNGDGMDDFTVGFDGVGNPGPNNYNKPYITGIPDSVPGSTPLAQLASDGWYGLPVTPFGTMIDSSYLTPVPDTAPGTARAYLNQDNQGDVDPKYPVIGGWGVNSPTEGYVGLEMYDNAGLSITNFGWAQLIYNNNLGTFTLVDYAYETTPGVGIPAGATNEVGAPIIYVEPASQTKAVGSTVQLSVVALANPAPTYQWRAAPTGGSTFTNLTDHGNITGSATPTLTLSGATVANAAQYQVVISNSLGVVTSSPPATLTVVAPVATPTPQVLFGGLTAHFTVNVSGLSPTFKWQKNGAALSEGDRITGSATADLQISNLQTTDTADYAVVLTSGSLSVTSSVSSLTVLPVTGESAYDAVVLAAGPVAYYRFAESGDPATNNLIALDNVGSYNGAYGIDVTNAYDGVGGPCATNGYPGFAVNNAAALFTPFDTNSQITVAPWNLNTDTVTFTFWVNPPAIQNYDATILWSGTNNSTFAGINYYYNSGTGAGLPGNVDLGYTWNENSSAAFFFWDSGIMPPVGVWSMVALQIDPSDTILTVFNGDEVETWPGGTLPASNLYPGNNPIFPFTNQVMAFGGPETIGNNPNVPDGAQGFNGAIANMAVFKQALTPSQLATLYNAALGVLPPVTLQIQSLGSNTVQLNWGNLGLLEQATNLSGPWTANTLATSPYTVTVGPTNPQTFYRVRVGQLQ